MLIRLLASVLYVTGDKHTAQFVFFLSLGCFPVTWDTANTLRILLGTNALDGVRYNERIIDSIGSVDAGVVEAEK